MNIKIVYLFFLFFAIDVSTIASSRCEVNNATITDDYIYSKPWLCRKPISFFTTCPASCKRCLNPLQANCQQDDHGRNPYGQFGCVKVPCCYNSSTYGMMYQLNQSFFMPSADDDKMLCSGGEVHFSRLYLDPAHNVQFSLRFTAPKGEPKDTDIYFLIDTTGSMNEEIGRVVLTVRGLIKRLAGIPGTRFGVGRYSDESDPNNGFENVQPLTADSDAAIEAAISLRTGDGSDYEEANLFALNSIAMGDGTNIGWRETSSSKKVIVMYGGGPGHEPTCGNKYPVDREVVTKEMKKKGIVLYAVNMDDLDGETRSWPISGCGGRTTAPRGQASFITKETGGKLLSNDLDAAQQELIKILAGGSADGSAHQVAVSVGSSCEKEKIEVACSEYLPMTLKSSESKTSRCSAKLLPGACDAVETVDCKMTYRMKNFATGKTIYRKNLLVSACH